uniref:Uncharacterized protein n=1 Tax=Panagrolaimus sp. JU765 TaxID=591449 RepID=A0AC34Q091_9BILA
MLHRFFFVALVLLGFIANVIVCYPVYGLYGLSYPASDSDPFIPIGGNPGHLPPKIVRRRMILTGNGLPSPGGTYSAFYQ